MKRTTNLSRPIIEALYTEALVLADEVRAAFSAAGHERPCETEDRLRLALSSEGLKCTTRMMHILAWLLNQRAYFSGDLNEGQLRKFGRLPDDRTARQENLDLLEPATRELIDETMYLHRRIARLDQAWNEAFDVEPVVRSLHERISREMNQQRATVNA
jgi:regulator of CtrA degradation